jgi:hypothetical protein
MEVVVKVSAESEGAMCESGSGGQCGCVISEVAMCENGSDGQSGCVIRSGQV